MKSIRLAPGTRPTLSVVLPMYNEAEVIALTLREISALMTALEPSYEIVCVDDGSSDDTVAIVRRKASRDPAVGPSENHN